MKPLKLNKLKKIIDKAVENAEGTDPLVEFWVDDELIDLKKIGQFGIIKDVSFTFKGRKKRK